MSVNRAELNGNVGEAYPSRMPNRERDETDLAVRVACAGTGAFLGALLGSFGAAVGAGAATLYCSDPKRVDDLLKKAFEVSKIPRPS
ncbi:MAG: hypothetical protein HZB76_06920 [Chlamydiae bacterium]|nr:hypothetical protein [Chlamydiota bacterium]